MTTKYTRAQLVQAAWETGNLKYKLRKHQVPIYNNIWDVINNKIDARSYVVLCARRFGKTFTNLLITIEFAIMNSECEIQFIGPTQKLLIKAVEKSFNIIIADCPQELKPIFNSQNEIRFPNGSVIYFTGVDMNSDGVRGAGSSLNMVEEAGFISNLNYIFRSQLVKLTRETKGKTIFITTPSITPDHDFTEIYREHAERGHSVKYTTYDNTSMSHQDIAEAIADAGGEKSTSWRREDMVEFVTDSELQIIPEWKDSYKQDVPLPKYYNLYHKYIAMDPGVTHLTAVIFAYYDFTEAKLIIEDELTMNGPEMTTDKLAQAIKFKRDKLWGQGCKVYRHIADNNNKQLLNDLPALYNLPFFGTDKKDLDSMINKVRVMVGQGKIIVNTKCEHVLGCLEYGVWKDKTHIGKMFATSLRFGHYDALAALVYLVRNYNEYTNPIPANIHYNPAIHIMPQEEKKQDWNKVQVNYKMKR